MTCPSPDRIVQLAFSLNRGHALSNDDMLSREHIAECETCSSLFAEWSTLGTTTRDAFRDGKSGDACPDDNLIAEYLDGIVTQVECRELEKHFVRCSRCIEQLCTVSDLLLDGRIANADVRIALVCTKNGMRLLTSPPDCLVPIPLTPAPTLSSPNANQSLAWTLSQNGYDLRLTLQHVSDKQMTLHVELAKDAAGRRIALRGDGILLEARAMDTSGAATFFNLLPAEYDVEIELSDHSIFFSIGLIAEK